MSRASAAGFVSRHSTGILAGGIVLGVAMPEAARALRPTLPACIAGLLVISMLRIPWPAVREWAVRPIMPAALALWLLALCPLITWVVVAALPVPAALVVPLVLMAATPPLFSTPAMAFLWGLDAPLALVLVVLATLAGPFSLVLVAAVALDLDLGIEPLWLSLRLSGLIGGSLVLAAIIRRLAGAGRVAAWAEPLNAGSVGLLLVFAVAVMDGVPQRFAEDPRLVLVFAAFAFGANLVLQVIGAVVTRPLGMRRALTVGYASGNRALGLLLAVLPAGAAPDTVLFFALAQFPIYVLPALLAPLYRRLGRA